MRNAAFTLALLLFAAPAFAAAPLTGEGSIDDSALLLKPSPDELEPEQAQTAAGDDFEFYIRDALLREAFANVYDQLFAAAMLVRPGTLQGGAEYAVSVKEIFDAPTMTRHYAVAAAELAEPLGKHVSFADIRHAFGGTPLLYRTIIGKLAADSVLQSAAEDLAARMNADPVARCSADLDAPRAKRIAALWRAMILRARYVAESGLSNWSYRATVPDMTWSAHFSGVFGGEGGSEVSFEGAARTGSMTFADHKPTKPALLVALGEALRGYCKSKTAEDLAVVDRAIATLERKLPREGEH
jgi:hypothetical protein